MTLPDYETAIIKHRPYLLRLARQITKCGLDDAEDIVQGALARLNYAKLDEAKSACKSRMVQVVRWDACTWLAGNRPRNARHSPQDASGDTIGEGWASCGPSQEDAVLAGEVEAAIEALPPELREVLKLWLAGDTFKVIGGKVGQSEQAAQWRWKRGVKRLRERLR